MTLFAIKGHRSDHDVLLKHVRTVFVISDAIDNVYIETTPKYIFSFNLFTKFCFNLLYFVSNFYRFLQI